MYLGVNLTQMKKPYWLIVLLLFGACTMQMPPDTKARHVVEHYLDSINKPEKVELMKFIKLENKDIDNSDIDKHIESSAAMNDSDGRSYRKWLNYEKGSSGPNGYYCNYQINDGKYVAIIRLDTSLSRVVRVTYVIK